MLVQVQNDSINLQDTPSACLIENNDGCVSRTTLKRTLVLVIPFQKLILDLSLLSFFLFG